MDICSPSPYAPIFESFLSYFLSTRHQVSQELDRLRSSVQGRFWRHLAEQEKAIAEYHLEIANLRAQNVEK